MKLKLHVALHCAFVSLCLAGSLSMRAQGFPSTATNWGLPPGGEKYNGTNYSFRAIGYLTGSGDDTGSHSWTVMDMNGDSKLDIVVYQENQANGVGVFSQNSNPYWKVYLGTSSGFAQAATNWALPPGGEKDDGVTYGFRELSHETGPVYDIGSESYTVMDMNGDRKPDMVVYNANQTDDVLVFGSGANRYWKVYLNTGSGFSQTAVNWTLPAGGEKDFGIDYGFRNVYHKSGWGYDFGSQSYTTIDMNGDSKPDMVVYNEKQATDMLVFGQGAGRYWKVFLNTGSGFSPTATNWNLPPGGEKDFDIDYSFREIQLESGWGFDFGSQSYSTMDMNGDSKPDMVVYNEKQSDDMYVFGQGTNKYWKVFLNTGSGFSQTATNWTLPAGGEKDYGIDYSFRAIHHVSGWGFDFGSQSYTTMDMNGDSRPDMVIYNEKQADDMHVYGQGASKYWKVYFSTGSGFSAAATNWSLPSGGETYNGTNYSFRAISYVTGAVDSLGSQSWTIMDMNGDSKPDMVAYNENQTAGTLVYGQGSNPFWKVYLSGSNLEAPSNERQSTIVVYPNPASANLYVKGDALSNGGRYSLFDTNGRMILSGSLTGNTSPIDISSISRGVYFLKIEGSSQAAKIIKE